MNQLCTFNYEITVTYPDGKAMTDKGEFDISFSPKAKKALAITFAPDSNKPFNVPKCLPAQLLLPCSEY